MSKSSSDVHLVHPPTLEEMTCLVIDHMKLLGQKPRRGALWRQFVRLNKEVFRLAFFNNVDTPDWSHKVCQSLVETGHLQPVRSQDPDFNPRVVYRFESFDPLPCN